MSTPTNPTTIRSSNPFEAFRLDLIKRLLAQKAPGPLGLDPHPSDFEAVAQHVRAITRLLDAWLGDVGAEVQMATSFTVEQRCFVSAFSDAIDGNAAYVIEEVANEMRDAGRRAA
jgi:hypothetical protein